VYTEAKVWTPFFLKKNGTPIRYPVPSNRRTALNSQPKGAAMISGSKIIGFIPIRDAECALDFYQNLLGLHLLSDDSFAIVLESNGSMIRLVRTEDFTPAPYTILGWQVENIEEVVKELTAKGLLFQRYSFLDQSADGIWTAPEGAKIAWFHDPDGNTLSFSQQ
jgi:catechol 2,3-dioxygenase-like lactoylglutathione lyase family enzyme